MKKIFLLIFFITILSNFNLIKSQIFNNISIKGLIGLGDIRADIGNPKFNAKELGFSSGLQVQKMFRFGINSGIGYHYSYLKNDDKNTANFFRGYEAKTSLRELDFFLNCNLINLINGGKNPWVISLGSIISYYISNTKINHEIMYSSIETFNKSSKGFVMYPNLIIGYAFNKIQIGVDTRYGISSNDLLEGFTTKFSKLNDRILVSSLFLCYKIK